MDGAEFSLAPLTYDEMEEYARRVKATQEKIADLKLPETAPVPQDLREQMRDDAFYALCCGLNNAGAEPPVTSEMVKKEIDDQLGAELVVQTLKFNGLNVERASASKAGEPQASS